MKEKMDKLNEFFSKYSSLLQQEEALTKFQQGMESQGDILLQGALYINGQEYDLVDLISGNSNEATNKLDKEISFFISYLLHRNKEKMENLLSLIEIKEDNTMKNNDKFIETTKDALDSFTQAIKQKIEEFKPQSIISPMELYDRLNDKELITLSDVHELLREYVNENKMKIIHHAYCYKCSYGYEKYYDVLPREVTCGACGRDIVNIEIHYQKLY